jgi:hypothetical protein
MRENGPGYMPAANDRLRPTEVNPGRTDRLTVVPIAAVTVLNALNHKAIREFITMMDQLQGSGVSTWGTTVATI